MPPRATAFEGLAPDQRAAVELVLRQGRSYGELADLLGLSEDTIRARARGGLEALAPDLAPPPRSGEVADWLLGQQAERHAARTRELLLSDPTTRRWAETVAAPLRELYGDDIPSLPTRDEPAPRPRPLRAETPPPPREPEPEVEVAPEEPRRSSRVGGAILLGAVVIAVVLILVFVVKPFGSSSDSPTTAATTPAATAAPSATATAGLTANDILLRGPAGSKAVGLMRLFEANDNTVRFALAAQGVEPNQAGETYSLWFEKKDGSALLLGAVRNPVGKNGQLTSAGPGNSDVSKFPTWFATYDTVVVSRDGKGAKKPGVVILSGNLPHSQSG